MNLETVVLGFLSDEPMTGYDLSKRMDISVGFFWHATHPQIYTCLRTLESEGFVVSRHELPATGPSRKVYSITQQGKEELLKNLAEAIPPQEGKFPLLATMFFGAELGREHWVKAITAQIREQEVKLQVYKSIQEQIPQNSPSEDFAVFLRRRTVEFGIGYQRHFLKWLRETLKAVES